MADQNSSNLMGFDELISAKNNDMLYVVRDNLDYRIAASSFLRLVNAAFIGLGEVDNTPDAEKPVSHYQQLALDGKMDKATAEAAITALASALEGKVSTQLFEQAITALNEALSGLVGGPEFEQQLETALAPIQAALDALAQSQAAQDAVLEAKIGGAELEFRLGEVSQTFSTQLTSVASRVTALESWRTGMEQMVATLAPRNYVDSQIDQLSNQFQLQLESVAQQFTTQTGRIQNLEDAIVGVNEELAQKADRTHRHTVEDLDGLGDLIQSVVDELEHPIIIGPNEW